MSAADVDNQTLTSNTRRLSTAASVIARRPGLWIALAVLLAAGVLGLLQARGPMVNAAAVTRADIE